MALLESLELGIGLEGTARAVTTPTAWLLAALVVAALMLARAAPFVEPMGVCALLWFVGLVALNLLLLAALHLSRPRGPDDPPRRFVESYARVIAPLVVVYLGLFIAGVCVHSCLAGDGALGTQIFAGLGGLLALGGLAAAVHNVRRRL